MMYHNDDINRHASTANNPIPLPPPPATKSLFFNHIEMYLESDVAILPDQKMVLDFCAVCGGEEVGWPISTPIGMPWQR